MNFNFAPRSFEIQTKCDKGGHLALKPFKMSVPSGYLGEKIIAEGFDMGACEKCDGVARSVGVVIEFLSKDRAVVYTLEEVKAREEKSVTGDWQVQFLEAKVKSSSINASKENLHGTVTFRIWKEGDIERRHAKVLAAVIRQPSGGSHEFETTPIEVEVPESLKYKLNYLDFRNAAEEYFRTLLGAQGRLINTPDGASVDFSGTMSTGPSRVYSIAAKGASNTGW